MNSEDKDFIYIFLIALLVFVTTLSFFGMIWMIISYLLEIA